MQLFMAKKHGVMVPKYRSTNIYTSNYIRHRTVQCKVSRSVRPVTLRVAVE